jgi:hypothetical protein
MTLTTQSPAKASPTVALIERVETVHLDWRRFLLCRAALWVFLGLLIFGGLLALADWMWLFSQSLRLAVWLLLGLVAVALVCHRIVLPRRPFSRGDAAAEIERAFPHLGQRISTSLEYAEPTPTTMPAWPSLIRALLFDTEQRTAGLAFDRVVPWRVLRRPAVAAVGLGGALAVMLLISPQARIAAMRLFLIPVHYTQVVVDPGDQTVTAGNNLTVRAAISGRPVTSAALLYRDSESDGEWTAVSLAPDTEQAESQVPLVGDLETTLKNCQHNLQYRVVAGPVQSPTYALTVLHPLVLQKVEATIVPPAYTRQKASVVAEADFRVIEGSRVQLRFTLDRAPQTAELRRFAADTLDAKAPLQAPSPPALALDVQENVLTGEFASVTAPVAYELHAEAADGMRLEPKRFRIQVQPDRKPTIRFVKP